MTKEQFLHDLTVQLNLSVSDQVIHEQLAYYDNYIISEIQKGRNESDVIDELGSPRLLAKTIIETAEAAGDPVANQDEEIRGTIDTEPYSDAFDYERGTVNKGYQSTSESSADSDEPHQNYENESRREQQSYSEDGTRNDNQRSAFDNFFRGSNSTQDNNSNYGHIFTTSGWGCLIFMIIFFVILEILINIIGGILYFLSPYLLPMMVAACVVWLIYNFIK